MLIPAIFIAGFLSALGLTVLFAALMKTASQNERIDLIEPEDLRDEPASASLRYFVHKDGFSGDVAFLEVDEKEAVYGVYKWGLRKQFNNYSLQTCLHYLNNGKWKEITAIEAAALIEKGKEAKQL